MNRYLVLQPYKEVQKKFSGNSIAILVLLLVASLPTYADTFDASIDFSNRTPVYAMTKGIISAVVVEAGDTVRAGALLAELDATAHEARVQAQKQRAVRMQVKFNSLSEKFNRQQELFDRGSLSVLAYEESQNDLKIAESELLQAQAYLKIAEYRLGHTKIRAPDDSIIVQSNARIGMQILYDLQNKPLFVLAEKGGYVARISVPYEQRIKFKKADVYQVQIEGYQYAGRVEFPSFDPVLINGTRKYLVDLHFQEDTIVFLPETPAVVQTR